MPKRRPGRGAEDRLAITFEDQSYDTEALQQPRGLGTLVAINRAYKVEAEAKSTKRASEFNLALEAQAGQKERDLRNSSATHGITAHQIALGEVALGSRSPTSALVSEAIEALEERGGHYAASLDPEM